LNPMKLFARNLGILALTAPIRFYRLCVSPLMPPSCRFTPTCSRYAIESIERHGPVKGFGLGLRRILRCHPVTWLGGSSGFDPVPTSSRVIMSDNKS
jgi:uncharacterized protein